MFMSSLRAGTSAPASAWTSRHVGLLGLVILGACSTSQGNVTPDAGGTDRGSGGQGTGGAAASGGAPASGGATGTGGAAATGGATGTGGTAATGGTTATGGRTGTGGAGGGGRGGADHTGGSGGGTPGTGGSSGGGEFGFTYRTPGTTDVDWLCTFRQGGVSGHVYARFDQTGTMMSGIATVPVYKTTLAQFSAGGAPTDLANAQYDYGGGHHNDSIRFDHQGKTYKYYHSSFGFGFRQCQPMDCINVYALGATAPETEGCTAARTLPEICVRIKADGTHDPLTDRFMKCPGSP